MTTSWWNRDNTGLSNSQDLTLHVKPARKAEHGDSEAASAHDSTKALDAFFALLAGARADHHDGK